MCKALDPLASPWLLAETPYGEALPVPWDRSAGAAGACWGAWAVGTQRPSASCTMALEGHCGALLMPLACVVCRGAAALR